MLSVYKISAYGGKISQKKLDMQNSAFSARTLLNVVAHSVALYGAPIWKWAMMIAHKANGGCTETGTAQSTALVISDYIDEGKE
ncbi:hypothetical protein HHI36_021875 [Cryptolaemus montrouzieri]|uniref:Uncharacterized protein n=1 Tax=Cryptolaemus montrouzieri TaxID=559131 RepID=A0ABD2MYZ3_9CUCU